MFGLVKHRITMKEAARLRRIARFHGADFVHAAGEIPGNESLHGWFTCRASHRSDALEKAVLADVGDIVGDRRCRVA